MVIAFQVILLILIFIGGVYSFQKNRDLANQGLSVYLAAMIAFVVSVVWL